MINFIKMWLLKRQLNKIDKVVKERLHKQEQSLLAEDNRKAREYLKEKGYE